MEDSAINSAGADRDNLLFPNIIGFFLGSIFILPLILAAFQTVVGDPVTARDDLNYLKALEYRELFDPSIEFLSWLALTAVSKIIGVSELALRTVGLCIATCTLMVIHKKHSKEPLVSLFCISILPIYLNIYFNQIRLSIAILIFISFLLVGYRRLAAIAALSAHSSFALLIFPIACIAIPSLFHLLPIIEKEVFGSAKLLAYMKIPNEETNWYFGWELLGLAVVLATKRHFRVAVEVLIFLLVAYSLSAQVNVGVGRRVLEIAIFAYSPFILLLWRSVRYWSIFVAYYLVIGIFQAAMSLNAGVVSYDLNSLLTSVFSKNVSFFEIDSSFLPSL